MLLALFPRPQRNDRGLCLLNHIFRTIRTYTRYVPVQPGLSYHHKNNVQGYYMSLCWTKTSCVKRFCFLCFPSSSYSFKKKPNHLHILYNNLPSLTRLMYQCFKCNRSFEGSSHHQTCAMIPAIFFFLFIKFFSNKKKKNLYLTNYLDLDTLMFTLWENTYCRYTHTHYSTEHRRYDCICSPVFGDLRKNNWKIFRALIL